MNGKCPYCGKMVLSLRLQTLDATSGIGGLTIKAVAYNCMSCNAVLACEADPLALRTEIVAQTVNEIRRILGR